MLVPLSVARGYEPIGNHYRDYVRVLALLGKSTWTPRSFNTYSDGVRLAGSVTQDHLWADRFPSYPPSSPSVFALDPEARLSVNTHVPLNRNNQSQWEGRGLNAGLFGGVGFEFGPVRGTVAPEFSFAQNLPFNTLASDPNIESDFGDYFLGIDRPQRFGDDPLIQLWWGQTGVRFERWNLSVALTTENMWLGPATENAIVLSNNAPGFPRLDIGTAEPVQTRFGRFEAVTWWGVLQESDFFDTNSNNDFNFKLGYSLGYVPPLFDNLYLGFNRGYVSPLRTVDAFKVFQHFDTFFKSNRSRFADQEDDIHQVASITAHWFLPAAAFEVYVEWARNDHSLNLNDFLRNPEHAQAFTLGVRHAVPIQAGILVFESEVTKLGNNETTTLDSPRPTFPYYRHGPVPQGYTNRGQLLGAWIGTGSNSQTFATKWYFPRGMTSLRLTRHANDQDYYLQFSPEASDATFFGYDVRVTGEIESVLFTRSFDLGATIGVTQLHNWNWESGSPYANAFVRLSSRYRLN